MFYTREGQEGRRTLAWGQSQSRCVGVKMGPSAASSGLGSWKDLIWGNSSTRKGVRAKGTSFPEVLIQEPRVRASRPPCEEQKSAFMGSLCR